MRSASPKVSIRWLQDSSPATPGNGAYRIAQTGQTIEHARVLATVISKEQQGAFSMLVIDDCTDTIPAKCIEPCSLSVGDLADFFALLKENEGDKYLLVEFARKLTDPNFEILRKLELAQIERGARAKGISSGARPQAPIQSKPASEAKTQAAVVAPAPSQERELKKVLIGLIDGSDAGMPYESILTAKLGFNEQQIENAVKDLLNRGEIYEPKIGIYKRLS